MARHYWRAITVLDSRVRATGRPPTTGRASATITRCCSRSNAVPGEPRQLGPRAAPPRSTGARTRHAVRRRLPVRPSRSSQSRCSPTACPGLDDPLAGRGDRAHDRAGVHPSEGRRLSICSRSLRVSAAPGRSALLTTNTSAISISPALFACTASPHPGFTTTTHGVGRPHDLDLDLAHADGLDEHPWEARRRRAAGPPTAWRAQARRGGRGSPSSG